MYMNVQAPSLPSSLPPSLPASLPPSLSPFPHPSLTLPSLSHTFNSHRQQSGGRRRRRREEEIPSGRAEAPEEGEHAGRGGRGGQ